jgi:hypothetical protein
MSNPSRKANLVLGLVGAVVGGTAGLFAFQWIVNQGFYALIVPPALLGLGAGFCARGRSVPLAIVCGIAGLGLALFAEWQFRPFKADDSFVYFIAHVSSLRPLTLIMIVIGTIASYRLALGMDEKPRSQ